ncbi:phage minor head protein [Streptomyces griseoincarnatus]
MADDETTLQEAEEDVSRVVADVLAEVAEEFADAVSGADELVAARFSVGRIARMWTSRMPRIVARLLGVAETAADQAAASVDAELDDDWKDLPGRYEDGRPLPGGMGQYVETTEHLLRAVGDRLADVARQELADGVEAGEDVDQLRSRLLARFAADGPQLGTARRERTAATEATRAWNTATLEAARALTGPDRPLVKQWRTRGDRKVRHAHDQLDGQLRLLDEPFRVGGHDMDAPGDPTAPASLVVNCFPGDTLVEVPSGLARIYRRWYEGPLIEVHTEDGLKLSGTPNHPLLTDTGWKPLESVEVGDQLIGTPVGVRMGAGDPDVENVPTSLAELYRAAHEAGMPSRVVRGGVDFHGDVADGDVEVVTVDGDLCAHEVPAFLEGVGDAVLRGPGSRLRDLPGAGDLRGPGQGDRVGGVRVPALAAAGLIGGAGKGGTLLEREALHTQPVGPTDRAERHPGGHQAEADRAPGHVEGPGERELGLPALVPAGDLLRVERFPADPATPHLLTGAPDLDARSGQDVADAAVGDLVSPHQVLQGLTGRVALHDVVRVERRSFSGHVYNLESAGGWYIANGIASHNCRCVLRLARAEDRTSSAAPTSEDAGRTTSYESQDAPAGAPTNAGPVTAAADGSHLMGGMIALIPTEEDAARLAIEGGEDADELHLTLFFLGDNGGDWTEDQRRELAEGVRSRVADLGGNITARAFGANHWNAGSDSPSWVWAVGDDRDRDDDAPTLEHVRRQVTAALEDTHNHPDLPRQHSPWVAHVCAAYSDDPALLEALEERLGPITFDRIRLAFAGDHIDIPLTTEEDDMPNEETAAGLPTRAWSTPGDTALAFENQQTGDGRIFKPGALEWSGGPWPLQYADEMLRGHEGAELAGAINTLGRDGDRITGDGVLYLTQRSGSEATMLLEEEAPLGVSVDLDDVDVEFVDRTLAEDEDGNLVLAASLAHASVMQQDDGSWTIKAQPAAAWKASAGGVLTRQRNTVELITGPGGQVTASAIVNAFAGTGLVPDRLTAAAGEPDDPDTGVVVHSETSGDFLVRITRARLRGATLVAVPAFAGARIVLDPLEEGEETAAAVRPDPVREALEEVTAAAEETRRRVVAYVRSSPSPVTPGQVAKALGIAVSTARKHLGEAVKTGHLVRLRPGFYVGATSGPSTEATASAGTSPGAPAAVHVHPATDEVMGELVASAWTAMQDADPMPAAWFAEPTEAELPPGSGGVHYSGGRIYGWVAQAGEPHAGYPGRNLTIESLGTLDLSHFLRARFKLDDGTFVKAGAFTMNVPHSRDGAECDTASCQFDDTRTVAGVVTVGLNDRGLWFSGAAAPWLSQWDRTVFTACQPSYHMRQAPDGRWQLRAVLSVPVPGHSSPLLAAAVERSNLALAASAAVQAAPSAGAGDLEDAAPTTPAHTPPVPVPAPAGDLADVAASLLDQPEALDQLLDALTRRKTERDKERRAEVDRLSAAFAATPPAPAGTPAAF